jgi:transcriptional regulator with XRE-family HTH domain
VARFLSMNDNANAPADAGTDLKDARQAAGLSQERLAQLAGCSTSTVRLAERGWQPSPEMSARLAKALEPRSLALRAPGDPEPRHDLGEARVSAPHPPRDST